MTTSDYEQRIAEILARGKEIVAEIEVLREEGRTLYVELDKLKDTRPDQVRKELKEMFLKAKAPLKIGKGQGRGRKTTEVEPESALERVAA